MSDFIQIGNSKFDLSKLNSITKEDVEKLNDKKLMDLFNAIAGDDGIADINEISLFAGKLKDADANFDNKISSKEFKQFKKDNADYLNGIDPDKNLVSKIFNLSISKIDLVEESDATKTNIFPEDFDFEAFLASIENGKTVDEIKDETIEFINQEFKTGMSMLNSYDPGIISKGWIGIKEFLKSELSKSNVAKNLYVKQETAELLQKAKNGELTQQEYYGNIKQLLFDIFPNIEQLDSKKQENIIKRISTLSPREVQDEIDKIIQLPNIDNANYNEELRKYLNDFAVATTDTTITHIKGDKTRLEFNENIKDSYKLGDAEKLMTFEEVFYDRYKLEYSTDNFERLTENKNKLTLMSAAKVTYNQIYDILHPQILRSESIQEPGQKDVQAFSKDSYALALENSIISVLDKLGYTTDDAKSAFLRQVTGSSFIIKDGQIAYEQENNTDGNLDIKRPDANSLVNLTYIAKSILNQLEKNVPSSGEIENQQHKVYNSYCNAFGDKDANSIVQAYINDSEAPVKTIRTGVETVSGAAALVSMFTCPVAAIAFGIGGSVAGIGVEAANEISRKSSSPDKFKELGLELATNAALFAAGAGAAKTGMATKELLLRVAKNCPRLVACIADVGVDVTLSAIANQVLTGNLNLEWESASQIISILAGHHRAGRFGKGKISRQDLDPTKSPIGSKALDDLAKTDPQLYEDYKLLRSKNLLPSTTITDVFIDPKSSLSSKFKNDIRKMATAVRNGTKPIDEFIPQYKNLDEAISKHKIGDTFSIKGSKEVYIMDETGPIKLDMDREMYYNLFPPLRSAKTQQGSIGNCYMVSSFIDAAMSNPKAKVMFLQKFHQRGNDIVFDIGSFYASLKGRDYIVYDNYLPILDEMPQEVVFKNAAKRSTRLSLGLTGAPGLQMAEQAIGYKYAAKDMFIYMNKNGYSEESMREVIKELHKIFFDNNYTPSQNCMNVIRRTYQDQKVGGDLFADNRPSNLKSDIMIAIDGFDALRYRMAGHGNLPELVSVGMYELTPDSYKTGLKLSDLVDSNYSDNNRYVMGASTVPGKHGQLEELAVIFGIGEKGKYRFAAPHVYRIDSIDKIKETVSIVNPWDTSKVVKLTFAQYEKFFGANAYVVDLTKTVKSTRVSELVNKLKNVGISTQARNGRYLDNREMLEKYFAHCQEKTGKDLKKPFVIDADANVCSQRVLQSKEVVEFEKRYSGIKANYHAQLEWANEDSLLKETLYSISKIFDNSYFSNNFKINLVSVKKNTSDYIFMLENARPIYVKLLAKGYSEDNIIQILHRLTKDNFNVIRELWE